uniref:Uncharacterized protein n=1 Tax=Arundo donax TaxID=35708 RepID=A0A0A8ZIN3_ARUDO
MLEQQTRPIELSRRKSV